MKARLVGAVLLVALALTGCRDDTVDLSYRFQEDSTLTYRMDAVVEASWDIGGPGGRSSDVTFEITESVESVEDGEAVVAVVMEPTEVREDGLAIASKDTSFTLRIGPNGEVLEIIEVDGVPASALDPEELVFIGTYRPPLTLEAVGLDDTWESKQLVDVGPTFQETETLGRLSGFEAGSDGELADLDYSQEGPLESVLELPQGNVELRGSTSGSIEARLDLSQGALHSATSSTQGDFEVVAVPTGGGSPINGTLQLSLELDLVRL